MRPGQGKASGRSEVELGNIDCRTRSKKVGKESGEGNNRYQ